MTPSMSSLGSRAVPEGVEAAARHVERMMHADSQLPSMDNQLRIGSHVSVSGLHDVDYPASLCESSLQTRVPLPPELVEHFGHLQSHCLMGLFIDVRRAFLAIDSDLYVWKLNDNNDFDLAFYDGSDEIIMAAQLIRPKPNMFRDEIKFLLALLTPNEIVLLGVTFSENNGDPLSEMHLIPEPLFSLRTNDTEHIGCICGSAATGRIFLGAKDGALYEFVYRADEGYFSKKATLVNHSSSSLSFLVPTFVSSVLYDNDPIVQIVIDDTRSALYCRTQRGSIQLFDLGANGDGMAKVALLTEANLVQQAAKIAENVDSSLCSPIVGISVVPLYESLGVSLIATTASGLRFYFATSDNRSFSNERVSQLKLVHIRLPPGFTPSSKVPRPIKIHSTLHKKDTFVMCGGMSEENDVLWLLSSAAFAIPNVLSEEQTANSLDSRCWAMDDITPPSPLKRLFRDSFGCQDPPSVLTQHCEHPRQLAILSAHGAVFVTLNRPLEQLKTLLRSSRGSLDNDALRGFFNPNPIQALATCLILASSQRTSESDIAMWARNAFFWFGGKPRFVFQPMQINLSSQQKQPQQPFSPIFNPQMMSTPAPHVNLPNNSMSFLPSPRPSDNTTMNPGGMAVSQELHYSFKHEALHLYFARLVRPFWTLALLLPIENRQEVRSSISAQELSAIITPLKDLATFLDNAFLSSKETSYKQRLDQQENEEAVMRERQSISHLRDVSLKCAEMLSLWRLLCEHDFNSVFKQLRPEDTEMLQGFYFRDLIVAHSGIDKCVRLVQALINVYLKDNASIDAISQTLRRLCPSLYKTEDAATSKIFELLIAAREVSEMTRHKMISDALKMALEIADKLELDILTDHLCTLKSFDEVVQLCVASAAKRDEQNIALHYYKNDQPNEDIQGRNAYDQRMKCYNRIFVMLERLESIASAPLSSPSLPTSPGKPPASKIEQETLSPQEAVHACNNVYVLISRSKDELLHVSLFEWLITRDRSEQLLSFSSSFLEDYLTREARRNPESFLVFDLLWKYYERNKTYQAAAKVLAKLADRHSPDVSLKQRLEYLCRALMCVKSGEVGSLVHTASEMLHHLEEKIDVARIQLLIHETIRCSISSNESLLRRLNADLLDISTLFVDFAQPLRLYECQLAILHCSGHLDQPMVQGLWENIIDNEINKTRNEDDHTRTMVVAAKIVELGNKYGGSQKFFPIELITRKLEVFSCDLKMGNYRWAFEALLAVGTPMPTVLDVYDKIYKTNDPVWLSKGKPYHLYHVMAALMEHFVSNPALVPLNERRRFSVNCLDLLSHYLGDVYAKHDNTAVVRQFKAVQAKLERL